MKAYLQQYAIYPPFLGRSRHSSRTLYIAVRFSTVLHYKKFLFRWSKYANPSSPVLLIALFKEAKEGDINYPFKPKDIHRLTTKIVKDKRSCFKTEFIHYGKDSKHVDLFCSDLKLIGDECCFQALKRKENNLFFLYTNENSIPEKNIFSTLLSIQEGESFSWGKTALPNAGIEFPQDNLEKAKEKLSSLKEKVSFKSPHLFFSIKEYVNIFGKDPSPLSIQTHTASHKERLSAYISMDTAFLN